MYFFNALQKNNMNFSIYKNQKAPFKVPVKYKNDNACFSWNIAVFTVKSLSMWIILF